MGSTEIGPRAPFKARDARRMYSIKVSYASIGSSFQRGQIAISLKVRSLGTSGIGPWRNTKVIANLNSRSETMIFFAKVAQRENTLNHIYSLPPVKRYSSVADKYSHLGDNTSYLICWRQQIKLRRTLG
jgi:hypothetical protein